MHFICFHCSKFNRETLVLKENLKEQNHLHLSLGKVKIGEEENFINKLKEKWVPIEFVLKEIYLLTRDEPYSQEKGGKYVIRKVIPLGGEKGVPYHKEINFEYDSKYDKCVSFTNYDNKIRTQMRYALSKFKIEFVRIALKDNGKEYGWGIVSFCSVEEKNRFLESNKEMVVEGHVLSFKSCFVKKEK